MTEQKKTDNHDPRSKLQLRRHFLQKYHPQGTARVLDCCMGSGFIWQELRREWQVAEYVGLDVKPKKGRLKIDSARYLEAGGWNHDCIDIDTYGAPWRHWLAVLRFAPAACTVFLTIGLVRMGGGGNMQNDAKNLLGIPPSTPPGILGAMNDLVLRTCLAAALDEFRVVECLEAHSAGHARYIGIRLEKQE
jgi:hypothetical protein